MCTSNDSFLMKSVEKVSAILGVFIGGDALTVSIMAFEKWNANLSLKPLNLPSKNYLSLCGLLFFAGMWVAFFLIETHLISCVGSGCTLFCIAALDFGSGWALVAEDSLLDGTVLTLVGSLSASAARSS